MGDPTGSSMSGSFSASESASECRLPSTQINSVTTLANHQSLKIVSSPCLLSLPYATATNFVMLSSPFLDHLNQIETSLSLIVYPTPTQDTLLRWDVPCHLMAGKCLVYYHLCQSLPFWPSLHFR